MVLRQKLWENNIMSTKYRDFDSVPTDKLKERLRELSNAISKIRNLSLLKGD